MYTNRVRTKERASEAISSLLEKRAELSDHDNEATRRQHARGKLTARERIDLIFDEDTFREIGALRRHEAHGFGLEKSRPSTDGVVTGWGTIHGRRAVVAAADFRILGGSLGTAHAQKIQRAMDLALDARVPFININDGGGARIQEGVRSLAGYGGIFRRHVAMSGLVPQISVILGPCAGGAAYSPALTDFTFMVDETSQMFLTGPGVIAQVTGEKLSANELGGAEVHASQSGLAAFRCANEEDCLEEVRCLVAVLPQNCFSDAEEWHHDSAEDPLRPALDELIPVDPRTPYDARDVLKELSDEGDLIEVCEEWAPNLITSFGHVEGKLVGFVANQPLAQAGVLDIESSDKGARFVQFCDSFQIPIVTVVDVPGFLPGSDQEKAGVIRHGAKLLYAYCNASTARIQVITRKAYGGAYIVMDSQAIGSDLTIAWPSNEVAVMGAEGAAEIIFRKEITGSEDPEEERQRKTIEYKEALMHPYYAPERGLVDEIIRPSETRAAIAEFLSLLGRKPNPVSPRKHGNPPQ